MDFRSFFGFWVPAALLLVVAGASSCKRDDSAAKLAEKERELAAKERELQEAKLAERERAVAAREEAASVRANSPDTQGKGARRNGSPQGSTPVAPQHPSGPRMVTVTATIAVAMSKPAGGAWDVAGDAPDPTVTARVGSSGASASKSYQNQQSVTAAFTLKLLPTDTVSFTAVDKDVAANDPIGSFTASYRGRPESVTGNMGAAQITVKFADAQRQLE
jgi:outer membrane murein-binding lipoprotein Lpp